MMNLIDRQTRETAMKRRHGWLAVALLAVLAAGCDDARRMIGTGSSGPDTAAEPESLVAQARPPLVDVPLPVGFDLTESKSRSMSAPGVRMVDHWYAGREDKWAVGRFYKRQMPACQWALESDRMVRGDIELDFLKGRERARVTISDGSWGKTDVHVEIYLTGLAGGVSPSR
jgi:hypothetical protein